MSKLNQLTSDMFSALNSVVEKRDDVMSKKFDDPSQLAHQYNKILDISVWRQKCKKKHENNKHRIRGIRERYGDLQINQFV